MGLLLGFFFLLFLPMGTHSTNPGVRVSLTMECILEGWSRFSLSDKEVDRVRLEKKQQTADSNEIVLAAKFLNRRVLNVDAIGGTSGQFGRLVRVLIFGKSRITYSFVFLSWRMMQRGSSLMSLGVSIST